MPAYAVFIRGRTADPVDRLIEQLDPARRIGHANRGFQPSFFRSRNTTHDGLPTGA